MRARLVLLSMVLLLAPGAATAQQDVKLAFHAATGTFVRYHMQTTQSRQGDGEAAPTVVGIQDADVSFRVLSSRDDGYRIAMNYEHIENQFPRAKALGVDDWVAKKVAHLLEGVTLVYICDVEGNPTQLDNLDQVRIKVLDTMKYLRKGFDEAQMSEQARAGALKMLANLEETYNNLTPQQANQMLLEDVKPLFGLTSIDLPQSGEIHFEDEKVWGLTGTKLVSKSRLWLTGATATQVTVQLQTGLDRDMVHQGLALAMQQLAVKYNGAVPEQLSQAIRNMENYDVQEAQTSVVRVADGWPDSVTLERRVITGPEQRIKRIVTTRLE